MIEQLFTKTVLVGILASGIRLSTPYLYAAIGETFSQRSGVLNLGVEGQMLLGAFAAFYVTFATGNLWLGLLAAVIAGLLMGLAMAFVSINLQAAQGISGIGFYLFGLGLSDLLFQRLLGTVETVSGFRPIYIAGPPSAGSSDVFSLIPPYSLTKYGCPRYALRESLRLLFHGLPPVIPNIPYRALNTSASCV